MVGEAFEVMLDLSKLLTQVAPLLQVHVLLQTLTSGKAVEVKVNVYRLVASPLLVMAVN